MVRVKVHEGESIDEALRRFKRQCERDGILQEIKRREFYKPPSVVRKEKLQEARRLRSRRRRGAAQRSRGFGRRSGGPGQRSGGPGQRSGGGPGRRM